jgi:hypothetical protein
VAAGAMAETATAIISLQKTKSISVVAFNLAKLHLLCQVT